ncbi:MAG TPA: hypothetical protein VGO48_07885 [Conexibacter sp.]|jgi:hypothetical protein|nr:hypothetical protein [Conexibacter sp.]
MEVQRLLAPLREHPQDARDRADTASADEVVYRLALRALPVPGLPERLAIGDVHVTFVHGPVRAQQTVMRQRHSIPPVFDKHMARPELADRDFLAVFSLGPEPLPEDFDKAFRAWRAHTLAAAGLLASILDERVAGEEVFEDAVLLSRGNPIGAADMRGLVRSFLPFDVHRGDLRVLENLASFSLSESSAATRAARLYRRAVLEGPTADAYALLWMATECFSDHRSPSRKDIEHALRTDGIDPDELPVHVGLLIDLRGKIQHHGLEEADTLRQAYYEMEMVVRTLIRQEAGIKGGWWPAPNNAGAFSAPFDTAMSGLQDQRTAVWHEQRLPPPDEPSPLRLPRRGLHPASDARLTLDPSLGSLSEGVASIVIDAIEWCDPDMSLAVKVAAEDDARAAASPERILLPREWLTVPARLVNLTWNIHGLVGAAVAQSGGMHSSGDGVALVEAYGSWCQYRRLVTYGELKPSLLQMPHGRDLLTIGKLAGWAAAGDRRAVVQLWRLPGRKRRLARGIAKTLRKASPGPPVSIIDLARSASQS